MQQTPDMSELLRLAQSPAGRQLISLLQQSGGSALQNAAAKAATGDYEDAKNVLAPLLASPDVQKLLKELENKP